MGAFERVLLRVNWPSIVTSFFHTISATSLLLLTFLILRPGGPTSVFPFPAALAFLHTISIAIMLGFWTVFGLFKPRHIPMKRTLLLGFPDAVNTFLSLLVIQKTSLSTYQASRLAIAPVNFLFERAVHVSSQLSPSPRNSAQENDHRSAFVLENIRMAYSISAILLLSAAAVIHESAIPISGNTALLLVASVIFAAGSRVAQLSLLRDTNVTELQLQLYTKIGALPCLVLITALSDLSSPTDRDSLYNHHLPEQNALLVFLTSLLVFLSFVSMRASSSRSTESYFIVQSIAITICVFITDWRVIAPTIVAGASPSALWFVSAATVATASGVFGSMRDAQLDDVFQQSGCGAGAGALEAMESAETRVRSHREELRRQLLSQQRVERRRRDGAGDGEDGEEEEEESVPSSRRRKPDVEKEKAPVAPVAPVRGRRVERSPGRLWPRSRSRSPFQQQSLSGKAKVGYSGYPNKAHKMSSL